MNIENLTRDDFVYPRQHINRKTVEAYAEALKIDAEFPPIEVQKVFNYPDGEDRIDAILIIDGVHRWEAYKEAKLENIEIKEWKLEALDYAECRIELKLEASERNVRHGDKLTGNDKENIAITIAESDPDIEWTEQAIADKLGVAQQTISGWIKEIRAKQKAGRDSEIIRLSLIGWTQEEIADVTGLSRNRVSEIVENTNFGKIDNFLSEGRSMEWIAEHYSIDLTLTWALRLLEKKRTDQERAKELGIKIRPYNVWNFSECHQLFGSEYPGRIPGEIILHTLFFYTEQGDMVIDPMVGGGTTIDVCLAMARRCYGYDIANEQERPDIILHDLNDGWPARTKKADLIFWDPPYFSKKDEEYPKGSISSLGKQEYLQFFSEGFAQAHALVKGGTRLAFLMSDWINYETNEGIYLWDYANLIQKAGWNLIRHIQVPLPSQQLAPWQIENSRENKKLNSLDRYLLVGVK